MDKPSLRSTGLTVLILVALISFRFLLDGNLGTGAQNEGDVLPLARQYADPSWIPGDWYLNQPPGYRWLFQGIFGHLIRTIGFLGGSIVGRLLCYCLIAWGMVRIGRQLGLRLPGLVLTIVALIYLGRQSVAAKEWMLGGLEAKSVAYGLVVLAVSLLLEGRYVAMMLLLGLATSFHVLVGGWVFLAALGWVLLGGKPRWRNERTLLMAISAYGAGSVFALPSLFDHLFRPAPASEIAPSYIYAFIRLPHHLNPQTWNSDWWVRPLIYLIVLLLTWGWLHRRWWTEKSVEYGAQRALAEFTLLTLVPFAVGVAIAPLDADGRWLQYYPFRVGDVMLPFATCLLVACAVERELSKSLVRRRMFQVICGLLLVWGLVQQQSEFGQQVQAVRQFPGEEQRVTPELGELYDWLKTHTPEGVTIVSPPTEMYNLTWLTERPTIAKYKFFPQSKAGILGWYERMSDLSGGESFWKLASPRKDARDEIRDAMEAGYNQLTTTQAIGLMEKYRSNYFVTHIEHRLELPLVYRNARYGVYGSG